MPKIRESVIRDVEAERDLQDRMWGGPHHDDHHSQHDWIAYLAKHLGEAVHWPWTPERFRKQMVCVAALAVAAIDWVDRATATVKVESKEPHG